MMRFAGVRKVGQMFSKQVARGMHSYAKMSPTSKYASKAVVAATLLTCAGGLYLNSAKTAVHCEGEPFKMPYRILGNTGLQVSVLSYGFWATFGVKPDLKDTEGIETAKACLRTARDHGVNLFDNAEVYGVPFGEAERIMGIAIAELQKEDPEKWRRSDLIITTKVFWAGNGVNEKGLSKKHIDEGVANSLKRLQLDYVDLLFCHRPDPFTPTETVVRSMSDIVRSGKAKAWGTSEWSAQQITEAVWIARQYGLEPPSFEQPQYHMFHRARFESEYAPLFAPNYQIGTTIWSPLASGLLTGKYNDSIPSGSRVDMPNYGWLRDVLAKWHSEGKIEKVKQLSDYATTKLNCSVGQLAIAWVIKNKNVSTVLLGATKPAQLEENFGAIEVARKLTAEDMAAIEKILDNAPEPYLGYGGAQKVRSIDTI